VVGLLLVLLLFEAGYRMFGAGVAWIAAVLAVFEPNLLAHSTLVATDFTFACFDLAAVYALWRVAERPTLLRLSGCGMMTGLALAAKHSALLLLPTLALLAAVEVGCRIKSATPEEATPRRILGLESALWIGRLAAIYGMALLVLWSFYAFRYHARPDGLPLWEHVTRYAKVLHGHILPGLVTAAARYKLLPESYLFGLGDVLAITRRPLLSFLFGLFFPNAVWYYFPIAIVSKSSLGFLWLRLAGAATIKSWAGPHYRKAAYL